MRRHYVECKIEGEVQDVLEDIQNAVNTNYIKNIENILAKSSLSKEEKIQLIDCIQRRI